MKIDFTKKLKDIFGKTIEMGANNNDNIEYLTLGKVCYESLLAPSKSDILPKKFELFKLAKKAASDKPIEITAEEISTIKEMVEASGWSTLVVGSVFEIIESLK